MESPRISQGPGKARIPRCAPHPGYKADVAKSETAQDEPTATSRRLRTSLNMHEEAWRLENVRGSPLQNMSFFKRPPTEVQRDRLRPPGGEGAHSSQWAQKIKLNEGDRDVEGFANSFA